MFEFNSFVPVSKFAVLSTHTYPGIVIRLNTARFFDLLGVPA